LNNFPQIALTSICPSIYFNKTQGFRRRLMTEINTPDRKVPLMISFRPFPFISDEIIIRVR